MAFSSAPKAFQSLENTHRKRSVSFFKKSLEFYASSIELSEDGKNGKNGKNLWGGNVSPKSPFFAQFGLGCFIHWKHIIHLIHLKIGSVLTLVKKVIARIYVPMKMAHLFYLDWNFYLSFSIFSYDFVYFCQKVLQVHPPCKKHNRG